MDMNRERSFEEKEKKKPRSDSIESSTPIRDKKFFPLFGGSRFKRGNNPSPKSIDRHDNASPTSFAFVEHSSSRNFSPITPPAFSSASVFLDHVNQHSKLLVDKLLELDGRPAVYPKIIAKILEYLALLPITTRESANIVALRALCSFQKLARGGASGQSERCGFFINDKKNVFPEMMQKVFIESIPDGFSLGIAKKGGDGFFDACVQKLNELSGREEYTIKSLKLLCYEYVIELDKKCNANPSHPDNWVGDFFHGDTDKYALYVSDLKNIVKELEANRELSQQKLFISEGHHFSLNGQIICKILDIRIYLIEVKKDADGKVNKRQNFLKINSLIQKNGFRVLDSAEIVWNDRKAIHVFACDSHFVPVWSPRIIDPVDIFTEEEKDFIQNSENLTSESPVLAPLVFLSERLRIIAQELKKEETEGEKTEEERTYETISANVYQLHTVYQSFMQSLLNTDPKNRRSIFSPKAYIVGDTFDFIALEPQLARKLLCRDLFGRKRKKIEGYGNHAVEYHGGVVYKPNIKSLEEPNFSYINPGMEYTIFSLLQLFSGEHCVAAPTAWLKVFHAQKMKGIDGVFDGYLDGIVQAGLEVGDMSFHDLLLFILDMERLRKLLSKGDVIQIIRGVLCLDEIKSSFLEKNAELKVYFEEDSLDVNDNPKRRRFRVLQSEEQEQLIIKIIDIISSYFLKLSVHDRERLQIKQPKGLGKLLQDPTSPDSREFVKNLLLSEPMSKFITTLAIAVSGYCCVDLFLSEPLDGRRGEDGRQIPNILECMTKYAKYFSMLFPEADAEEIYDLLPKFLSRIDITHFSASFIGHLLANPSDAKPDNFQVKLIRDLETKSVISFQLIGIDNDKALANLITTKKENYCVGVKCVLYFLESAMKMPISVEIKERILSRPPIFWVLGWAKLLYEHSQRCEILKSQHVLLDEDLREDGVGNDGKMQEFCTVDIPLTISPTTLGNLYNVICRIRDLLLSNSPISHEELLEHLQPLVAKCYKSALEKKSRNVYLAYEMIHNGEPIESILGFKTSDISPLSNLFWKTYRNNTDSSLNKISISNAIEKFFETLDLRSFPKAVQDEVLEYCGNEFPKLKLLESKSFDINWLNERLLDVVGKGLVGATHLLLRAGAKANYRDDAGRNSLHRLCLQNTTVEKEAFLRTLSLLLECPTLDPNAYDDVGLTPLITLISRARPNTLSIVTDAIKKLVVKVNVEQADAKNGKTALTKAIERNNPMIFAELIKHQAGAFINVDDVEGFLRKYENHEDEEIRRTMLEAERYFIQNNSKYAYRRVLKLLCAQKEEPGSFAIHGAESGKVFSRFEYFKQFIEECDSFFKQKSSIETQKSNIEMDVQCVERANRLCFMRVRLALNLFDMGMEYAVGTLRRELIGHGASYVELFKFVNSGGNQSYPVVFSPKIHGPDFKTALHSEDGQNALSQDFSRTLLDHCFLSDLIVTNLLINPEEDGPDNYAIEPVDIFEGKKTKKTFRFIRINNNGRAFVEPCTKENGEMKPQVKSIIFCLGAMLEPIHHKTVSKFLAVDPEKIIRKWLNILKQKADDYQKLFPVEEKIFSLTFGFLKPSLIRSLYRKLLSIKKVFRKNPYVNGLQLLRQVIPELGVLYEKIFAEYGTAHNRFLRLSAKTPYPRMIARDGLPNSETSENMATTLDDESSVDETEQNNYGPNEALEELKKIHRQSDRLKSIVASVQNGDFGSFEQLSISQHVEYVIRRVQWRLIEKILGRQAAILSIFCKKALSLERLVLTYCVELKTKQLQILLGNSPTLRKLDLSGCPVVDNSIADVCERYTPALETLILRETLLTEFKSNNLVHLKRLVLSGCINLESVTFTGKDNFAHTSLIALYVSKAKKLVKLDVNSTALKTFEFDEINYEEIKKLIIIEPSRNPQFLALTELQNAEHVIFEYVVKGDLFGVKRLLNFNPKFATIRRDIVDLSGRKFKGVTVFQYAVWALDEEMWEMILGYLPKSDALKQFSSFKDNTENFSSHGLHFHPEPLLKAYKQYIDNFNSWYKASRSHEIKMCWCKEVGGEQRKMPAWMVYAFCEEGAEGAWPKGEFKGEFTRDPKHIIWWFGGEKGLVLSKNKESTETDFLSSDLDWGNTRGAGIRAIRLQMLAEGRSGGVGLYERCKIDESRASQFLSSRIESRLRLAESLLSEDNSKGQESVISSSISDASKNLSIDESNKFINSDLSELKNRSGFVAVLGEGNRPKQKLNRSKRDKQFIRSIELENIKNKFFSYLAHGDTSEVDQMLSDNRNLVMEKSDITSSQGTRFEEVTILQYAALSSDRGIWEIALKYLPSKEAYVQLLDLEKRKKSVSGEETNRHSYIAILGSYWGYLDNFESRKSIQGQTKSTPILDYNVEKYLSDINLLLEQRLKLKELYAANIIKRRLMSRIRLDKWNQILCVVKNEKEVLRELELEKQRYTQKGSELARDLECSLQDLEKRFEGSLAEISRSMLSLVDQGDDSTLIQFANKRLQLKKSYLEDKQNLKNDYESMMKMASAQYDECVQNREERLKRIKEDKNIGYNKLLYWVERIQNYENIIRDQRNLLSAILNESISKLKEMSVHQKIGLNPGMFSVESDEEQRESNDDYDKSSKALSVYKEFSVTTGGMGSLPIEEKIDEKKMPDFKYLLEVKGKTLSEQKCDSTSLSDEDGKTESCERLFMAIQNGWDRKDLEKAIEASLQESEALQALKAVLLSEATSFGFIIKEMKRDGNCFFHGASDQLQEIGYPNSKIFTPEYLRQCVVQHLIDYLDLYKDSVEEIDEFIVKMSRAGEWADFVILHALARVLKVNIVLIRSDAQEPTVFRRKNPLGTLYLGYEVGLHFQSLVIDKKIKPEKNINAFIERAEIDDFKGVIKLPEVLPPQSEKQVYSENVKYTNNANNTNNVNNANNLNKMGIFASHESVQSASKISSFSSFLEMQSKRSGSISLFDKTSAKNSAAKKFIGGLRGDGESEKNEASEENEKNELNFAQWLSRDSVSVLLPLIVQKGNANVMTFCALDGGQGIAAYSSQIKKAVQEARKEEKSLFVISKEPSGFASQHYVLTIFHKERIYFIDPTGQVRNGFCKEFNALFAPFDMKKVPLLTSKTKLQNDPEKGGLVSCGVICLALCEFFAEEENLMRLESIQDKLETQKSLNEGNTYFMYNEFELSKLSPTLKSPDAESYREIMVFYRAKFYSMLNELDEEHIENLRETDHALLELIQEADIGQDEINRVGFGLNV